MESRSARGVAYFSLGEYDLSMADYNRFALQSLVTVPPFSDFTLGASKGFARKIYDSGRGMQLFLVDCIQHPVQTSVQLYDAATTLVQLARQDQWGVIAETLSPELHQLVTQWDMLSLEQRGELIAYASGKRGTDILMPGALAKVASRSLKSAQELAAVCRSFRIAEETLVLETAAEIGNTARVGEIVREGQKTAFLAEELGMSSQEMGQLKQAGQLETTVAKNYGHLSPAMQESFELYNRAQEYLKPYAKEPLPEFRVRELIHEVGIPTFPRPQGIPENYVVMISGKGAGMVYVHPTNQQLFIRVMPGKPHSPNPSQQRPYVVQQKNGLAFDREGNLIPPDLSTAHIPIEEFIFRE